MEKRVDICDRELLEGMGYEKGMCQRNSWMLFTINIVGCILQKAHWDYNWQYIQGTILIENPNQNRVHNQS